MLHSAAHSSISKIALFFDIISPNLKPAKAGACSKHAPAVTLSRGSLRKIGVDKLGERGNGLVLIHTIGYDVDGSALHNAERKHTEKAFGVHAALISFDPDAALELVSLLDEEGRRPCVKTYLIVYCYLFGYH